MSGGQTQRMTGSEVQCARQVLGLERVDLAWLLGNDPATVRDWERGKSFVPYRVREQIDELEALTAQAVERLVAELRQMQQPRAVVYRETDEPESADVMRLGRGWWRTVAARAASQVPGTRIGTRSEFDAMSDDQRPNR